MTAKKPPRLLLIEDDPDTAQLIRETLADHFGCDTVVHAGTVAAALEKDLSRFELVLSDLNLPDGTGFDLLGELLARRADLPVIVVTSEAALERATDAIRAGAYDYVVKAGDYLFTIPLIVEKNLAVWQTKVENLLLQQELEQAAAELRVKNQQLEDVVNQLERQAMTDPMTGLANRRHIQAMLERSFDEALRYGTDLTCVMIDVDEFKPYNDTLGHQQGDKLLQMMARVLSANCRRSDVAGRYGGDEFFLLLPHTSVGVAQQVATRIQQQFVDAARAMSPRALCPSLSIGIASVNINRPVNADRLVALADAALYCAKQQGKARIYVHHRNGPVPAMIRRQDHAMAADDGEPA